MRLILSLFIFTLTAHCSAQDFDLVKGEHEEYFALSVLDSFNTNIEYPNGRYKIFSNDSLPRPKFIFFLSENMVNGPYLEFKKGGYTYGNYYKDSTWSFLNAPNDTTFKIGTWRSSISSLGYSMDEIYQIPFDTDSLFTEIWYFPNGQLARKAVHQKGFGLIKETYWDFKTGKVSHQLEFNESSSYMFNYEQDTLNFVSIDRKGIEVQVDYKKSRFYAEDYTRINLYDTRQFNNGLPFSVLHIDSSRNVAHFEDRARQIFMDTDEDGNILIRYLNKNGKQRFRKIKTNHNTSYVK